MRRALLTLVLVLCLPAVARAVVYPIPVPKRATRYQVGISEQRLEMFSDATFAPLGIRRVRYIIPWDWFRGRFERGLVSTWLKTARAAKAEVLVHFTASFGCYDGRQYSKAKRCRAPSVKAYSHSVRLFHEAHPNIHVFGVWNEANHKGQPLYTKPELAARYYNAFRRICPHCTIVAADLLDLPAMLDYARAFMRVAKRPRLWGLHNYSDVNRLHTASTRSLLRTVPGRVWMTETGGLVRFPPDFPYSLKRAASRIAFMFRLADRLSRHIRGYRSRIARVYVYSWRGAARGAQFDAGLVGPNGEPRPAYRVFKRALATRSR